MARPSVIEAPMIMGPTLSQGGAAVGGAIAAPTVYALSASSQAPQLSQSALSLPIGRPRLSTTAGADLAGRSRAGSSYLGDNLAPPGRSRAGSMISNLAVSPVAARRRLSFDVPSTPDAYWSRSRAGSYNFGGSAVAPPAMAMPMMQPGSYTHPATQPLTTTTAMPMPTTGDVQALNAPYPVQYHNGMAFMQVPMDMQGMQQVGYPMQMPSQPAQPQMQPGFSVAPGPMDMYKQQVQRGAPEVQGMANRTRLELGSLLTGGMVQQQNFAAPGEVRQPVEIPAPVQPQQRVAVMQAPPMAAPMLTANESEEPITTLMLRNIPVKYNREMMLGDMDQRGFRGCYDFFYLPIDFQTGNTVGYAFVNFITADHATRFRQLYSGLQLSTDSAKICEVSMAKAQGKAKNVEQYRNSSVMAMEERFKPVVFENGVRVPFPQPTRMLKPVKPRAKQ